MGTVLFSVRLPAKLVAFLERVAERLESSPSHVVEALLRASEAHKDTILKITLKGAPYSEKVSLRLAPDVANQLKGLAPDIEPSTFVRSALAYFFVTPGALESVFPSLNDTDEDDEREEDEPENEEDELDDEEEPPRQGNLVVGLLVLLFFIGFFILVAWVVRRLSPPPSDEPPTSRDESKG